MFSFTANTLQPAEIVVTDLADPTRLKARDLSLFHFLRTQFINVFPTLCLGRGIRTNLESCQAHMLSPKFFNCLLSLITKLLRKMEKHSLHKYLWEKYVCAQSKLHGNGFFPTTLT